MTTHGAAEFTAPAVLLEQEQALRLDHVDEVTCVANKTALPLPLREGDRAELERLTRASTVPAAMARRARIVLLAADGVANYAIAERVGVTRPTVNLWRSRYAERGLAGLVEEQRPGRPRTVDRAGIITATLTPPPQSLGVTHWSSRLLAPRVGVDHATVAAVWSEYGVKPWKADTFKFSTDPELEAKVRDVIGLYLSPPENAIVLCVDEKSQVQALDRTQKTLPMQPGYAEQRTHDYVRHGTTTLFAALEIATGQVTGICQQRHRHQEFLAFLKHLARAYPDTEDGTDLHLVMDNYAAHKRVEIRDWLAANPRIQVHFTPTSGSWLNLVEVWFGIIERQAIRRGTFPSVRDLMIKIRAFITGWNVRKHPFIWTRPADEILDKINRKRKHVSTTRH
jgi:transposase